MKQSFLILRLCLLALFVTQSPCSWAQADVPALLAATRQGNIDYLREQHQAGVDLSTIHDPARFHVSLLHVAAAHGQIETMYVLFTWGIGVDDQNNDLQMTPLHVAAGLGQVQAVLHLLQAGANPHVKCRTDGFFSYRTPLEIAYWRYRIKRLPNIAEGISILEREISLIAQRKQERSRKEWQALAGFNFDEPTSSEGEDSVGAVFSEDEEP